MLCDIGTRGASSNCDKCTAEPYTVNKCTQDMMKSAPIFLAYRSRPYRQSLSLKAMQKKARCTPSRPRLEHHHESLVNNLNRLRRLQVASDALRRFSRFVTLSRRLENQMTKLDQIKAVASSNTSATFTSLDNTRSTLLSRRSSRKVTLNASSRKPHYTLPNSVRFYICSQIYI